MPIVGVDESPDVVAIVPTLGQSADRYAACIDSLTSTEGSARLAILVVLNSSTADPLPLARDGVRVVVAGLNLGWAGALSFGAHLSTSPYLWWMQDDVVLFPDTLKTLIAALEDSPELTCAAPLVVSEDGTVPPGSCGGVISADGTLTHWLPSAPCDPKDLPDLSGLSYVPSRALLVEREAFSAVGGPDPGLYPAQYVDVDFSFRLRERGHGGRIITEAHVRHVGGASTPSFFAQFLQSRNAQRFNARWFPDSPLPPERYFPVHDLRPDSVTGDRHPIHPAIQPDLLEQVAQSASGALTHLGAVFSAEQKQRMARAEAAEREIAQLTYRLKDVESSTSWRMTRTVRWLGDRLRRR